MTLIINLNMKYFTMLMFKLRLNANYQLCISNVTVNDIICQTR